MAQLAPTTTLPPTLGSCESVQEFSLTVLEGPDAGRVWCSTGSRCAIGTHESNDLRLSDRTVSRFHCEVSLEGVPRVVDSESKNGTVVDGLGIRDADLREGSLLRIGQSVLRFALLSTTHQVPVWPKARFGLLVGASRAMRSIFPVLEKAAACEAKVLLQGESGTGKGVTAESIHQESARRGKPFCVVDCTVLAPNLIESELFGHEKGAFTHAVQQRVGQLEEADGGTLFIDEVGELPLDLQAKLLRAVDKGEIRRVGGRTVKKLDVRMIAATKRDLRLEVNAGRFREDLYYRLAVICVRMPALREHVEDIPLLVESILGSLGEASAKHAALLRSPELIARLQQATWPGNVRELRNYVERYLVLGPPSSQSPDLAVPASRSTASPLPPTDPRTPYHLARQAALHAWEAEYLRMLLEQQSGKVVEAARAAGLGRAYMYRLLNRHGLRTR